MDAQSTSSQRAKNPWEIVAALAALGAALASAFAAYQTRAAAFEARRATQASVMLALSAEYGTEEMFSSMRDLRAYREQDPDRFAARFESCLASAEKSEQDVARKLDTDRRRVAKFFGKLLLLAQEDIIEEVLVGRLWAAGTISFLQQVLVPMECAKLRHMVRHHHTTGREVGHMAADCLKIGVPLEIPQSAHRRQLGLLAFFEMLAARELRERASTYRGQRVSGSP